MNVHQKGRTIIIPQGTIDPNQTNIIEISRTLGSSQTFITKNKQAETINPDFTFLTFADVEPIQVESPYSPLNAFSSDRYEVRSREEILNDFTSWANPWSSLTSTKYLAQQAVQSNQYVNHQSNQFAIDQSNQYINDQSNQYANDQSNQYANDQSNQYANDQSNQYANDQSNQYVTDQSNQYVNNAELNYMSQKIEHESAPYNFDQMEDTQIYNLEDDDVAFRTLQTTCNTKRSSPPPSSSSPPQSQPPQNERYRRYGCTGLPPEYFAKAKRRLHIEFKAPCPDDPYKLMEQFSHSCKIAGGHEKLMSQSSKLLKEIEKNLEAYRIKKAKEEAEREAGMFVHQVIDNFDEFIQSAESEAALFLHRLLDNFDEIAQSEGESVYSGEGAGDVEVSYLKSVGSNEVTEDDEETSLGEIKLDDFAVDGAATEDEGMGAEDEGMGAEDETMGAEDEAMDAEDEAMGAEDKTMVAEDETMGAEDETIGDEAAAEETTGDEFPDLELTADEAAIEETTADEISALETTFDDISGAEATEDELAAEETLADETTAEETIADEEAIEIVASSEANVDTLIINKEETV